MENTNNIKRSTRYLIPCTHADQFQKTQKGALLVGLIIVMLIFSILSGAMVYLFSSSTIGAAFANSSQRAYYAAEAGARYVIAQYRHTTPQMTTAQFAALSGTITLPNNNGKAEVTITDSMSGVTVDPTTTSAETKTLDVGETLTVNDATNFPQKNGFFKIAGYPSITFRYKTRTGNQLQLVTGQGSTTVNVIAGTTVTAPKGQVSIISKGFYPSDSLTSRTIEYGWLLSGGQQGGKKQDNDPMDNSANWADASNIGIFSAQAVDGGSALKVDSTINSLASARFTGFSNTNLAQAWLDAGGFLGYDVQVKVRNTEPYYFAGINFRLVNNSDNTEQYSYGVSFVKARQLQFAGSWVDTFFVDVDGIDNNLVPGSGTNSTTGLYSTVDGIALEESGWLIPYRYSKPAIVLWKRTSTGYQWIAYKLLTEADGIVTYNSSSDAYRLVNWSTIMVRISEGYSLTFTNGNTGTPIKEGDIITASSGGTARVVMTPILTTGNWSAGTPSAGTLVLANIGGNSSFTGDLSVGGSRLATAGTYSATKKNYIKVYYTRTLNQGTQPATVVETDNIRKGNSRDSINWAPDDITELNADNDYFTLVHWDSLGLNSIIPNLTSGWTFNSSTWRYNDGLNKYANGTTTASYPTPTITAGVTYNVCISFSMFQKTGTGGSRNVYYTLGEVQGPTIQNMDAPFTVCHVITANSSGGNLVFTPSNPSRFTISSISIMPAGTDIVVDSDLISPTWTTSSTALDFVGPNGVVGAADGVSLFSSGNSATSTYFDDFAIQMDIGGSGVFISPIQQ